ncbi:MAG TPA: hemolysin family protein [Mycobacteriales bacterium]|nr:hemolysin family protein [Mycobacteriales bacterium]
MLLFVLVGGVFAAAEIALVSLRESQVKALAERGRRGETVARLAEDPNRFLAAVQVGVTVAGFLSAAFGAATLAGELEPVLRGWGLGRALAAGLSLVVVTIAISYVSLVFSELAPKRLALQRAEGFALGLAPLLDRIATLSRPVIWLLSRSTDAVVRLLGGDPSAGRESITQEELRDLVAAHESLSKDERQLIDEVFAAGERQVREVLVPRTEVDFLDAALPVARAAEIVAGQPHSRYPVVRGSHDDVVGFVHVRDLLGPTAKRNARVGDVAREVKLLPATKRVLPALSEMRRERHHLAIVVDEYGGTAGIVTLEDLVEELIGDIRDEYDVATAGSRHLRGGDIEVDGLLNLDEFAEVTGIELPDGPYETVAGFVLATLGHLPAAGELVEAEGHRLTVTELDGRRVARLRVTAAPAAPPAEGTSAEVSPPEVPPAQVPPGAPSAGAAADGAPGDGRAAGEALRQ